MNPPTVALLRFSVMWLLLAPLCTFRGLSLRYHKDDAVRILVAGFLAMGVYMVLFLEGMNRTSPAEGAIILATSPVITYLFASALKQEVFSLPALLASFTAFVGVAIVIIAGASHGNGNLTGNLILLVSAVVWAFCVVFMKPLLKSYEATQLLTLSMPGAVVVLIPYSLSSLLHTNFGKVSGMGWLMFAQVSVLSGVVGFSCFYLGVKQVGASRATLYQYFVPPTAVFFAWLVMGKTLAPFQFLGLVVLLIGVIATTNVRLAAAKLSEVS